ncbi:phospholipid/cholesterol/gamma-HCH transport system substrate-binding protein [Meinhardsimonia xiamenensis]|jgi:phospholipid/cholesterol/gamma-HCH transport system substrate-binding protein|uniref:Phospholipid/cholesterol/gamma-HCH transport system substrate-binding protein n=1 Tax=Meinhardsimonia xiamenensis TaxID=990712 RepID=A0A1G9GCK4_9RHOB|nr:outer membrane lipid asymmetry maintenance protein MlaD [Meinhardsimonia xiamenensis]PRX31962.1 phospholipid/cholesterol/gamma-HCH transport system substrate-binding protein [Meinhardsimonia xiamenensis]SDK98399.1 phospholipid/cholesterol/gamma-HCH transport system substrate-binding protein [Meinhardsimonia xiamenensis]
MNNRTAEILVGAVVLFLALGFTLYAAQRTGYGPAPAGAATYRASFTSAQGISVGTDVRMAGVKVGSVIDLRLNPETFRAETTFTVDSSLRLPDDTAVLISSEGLLGGAFVELLPGGSPDTYEPGDEILDTQSAVSLVNLFVKFATSGGGETGGGE